MIIVECFSLLIIVHVTWKLSLDHPQPPPVSLFLVTTSRLHAVTVHTEIKMSFSFVILDRPELNKSLFHVLSVETQNYFYILTSQ